MKLSPPLFLILEFFILLPSLLFIASLIIWVITRNSFLYFIVLTPTISFQNVGVLLVSPLSSGILAYGYMERYKISGIIQRSAKFILCYSILFAGLVIAYYVATLFS